MTIVVSFAKPVLFTLFGLEVQSFGFFMALAFLVTYSLLDRGSKKLGLVAVDPGDILLCAILGGVTGSKLHCVISSDWAQLLSPTGFNFQGGALTGAAAVCLYLKYHHQNITKYSELILPLIPLGHAIGKLGCFFSGDGCYGTPSNLPWAMSFPNGLVPTYRAVHPTPLYECACGLVIWFVANRVKRGRTSISLVGMGVCRFFIEMLRGHEVVFWGFSQFQVFAVLTVSLGIYLYPRSDARKNL